MTYLSIVIIATLLFGGFIALTMYEARRGTRFFATTRYRLDTKVARMLFVIEHVDWGAFSAHVTRTTATTLAHDIAHGTLLAVRATERFLTRAVRALRSKRDNAATLPDPGTPAEVAAQMPEGKPALPVIEATVRSKEAVVSATGHDMKEQHCVPPATSDGSTEKDEQKAIRTDVSERASFRKAPAIRPTTRRSMDIPRRTKSKEHVIVQEPNDTPV